MLRVTFFDESSNRYDTFDIKAHILKATPVDLIIGRDSIKKFNLFSKAPSQLGVKLPISTPIQHAKCTTGPCDCPSEVPLTPVAKPRTGPVIRSLLASLTVEAQHLLGGSAADDDEIDHDKTDTFKTCLPPPSTTDVLELIEAQHLLGGPAPDDDEIDHDKTDTFKTWLPPPLTTDVLALIHISGDRDLQHQLRTLCKEFKDILAMSCLQHPQKYLNFI